MLVLEVDENNGHKDRNQWCECARMINISQSASGQLVIFLRYNPDSYLGKSNRSMNPSKLCRKEMLLRWLDFLKSYRPEFFVSILQLYYDGHQDADVKLHCLVAFGA